MLALPRVAWCLVALALASGAPAAFAQSGFYFVPLVAVEEVYDDNIFFDTEDEVSDFITRVSPQLDVGYESETLDWLLSYRNDAEWYRDLSDLDSTTARGFGIGRIEYQPNRRWTLTGAAEYTSTNTAEDLSLTPGGVIPGRVGRAEAERNLFGGGAEYRFSPRLTGRLDVSWIEDELIGISQNETASADLAFEQVLTPARTLQYAVRHRNYDFENLIVTDPDVIARTSQDSSTAWLGLIQDLSQTSVLELRAGPRFIDGDVEPYLFLNWRRDYARGNTTVEAAWDETTLLGETGRQESKSILASWTHEFSPELEVRGSAGYANLSGSGFSTDIASFAVSGIWRFTPAIFATARYGYNVQEQDPLAVLGGRIVHNVVSVSITFTRPRPSTQRSSN